MPGERRDDPPIDGLCDPKFDRVREEFRTNLVARGDVGAAACISISGRVVVDLWGGWSDAARTRPWQRDTLVNFFSVGKALASICALRLVEQGLVDLDTSVACYWPEFAQAEKREISLRHILSHQAGLPAVREPLPDGAMLDWPVMIRALERESPWWNPGTAHGYHVNTFGFLVGEVVRRVSKRSLGSVLRTEIAGPLGADVFIGLPASEHHRVAEFLWPSVTPNADVATLSDDELMRWNTYWNPPGLSGAGWVNTAAWRSAELPSTNGHGTARGVARVYAALARWGEIDNLRIIAEPILRLGVAEHSHGPDRIMQRPSRFGLGFQLTQPERLLGPNIGAFGHFGAGGALGFCDPDADLAFGYVMNDLGPRWQNPRNRALIDAVYACL
jgi:CubicO group peptidase (beta-lactamase class C family)